MQQGLGGLLPTVQQEIGRQTPNLPVDPAVACELALAPLVS